jgi:hypothetical protein
MGGAAGGGRGPPPSHRPEERQSSNGFGALIDDHDEDYFSDLYCPLTLEVMTDPVVCAGRLSILPCPNLTLQSLSWHCLLWISESQ